jgi:hypothetical protein
MGLEVGVRRLVLLMRVDLLPEMASQSIGFFAIAHVTVTGRAVAVHVAIADPLSHAEALRIPEERTSPHSHFPSSFVFALKAKHIVNLFGSLPRAYFKQSLMNRKILGLGSCNNNTREREEAKSSLLPVGYLTFYGHLHPRGAPFRQPE